MSMANQITSLMRNTKIVKNNLICSDTNFVKRQINGNYVFSGANHNHTFIPPINLSLYLRLNIKK